MSTIHSLANNEGLLFAKKLSPEGFPIDLDLNDIGPYKSSDGILWLHMCAIHPDTRQFLTNETDLDEMVVDALLSEETRPRILARKEGAMVILRAMNLHHNQTPEDMISLRMWVDNTWIITTRRRDILAIEDVKNAIEHARGPKTAGEFLTMITNRVYTRMEKHIERLEDCVSNVEEVLAQHDISDISENISEIRTKTAIFRRYIVPQRYVLEGLIKANVSWLSEEDIMHLVESHDRVIRYVETLNDIRDRAQIINDEIDKRNAARLNSMTYMFSVAATIFLPLTFLTGLLGVNIGGMPGIDKAEAFWLFTTGCIIIAAIEIIIFKKLKWF